MQRHKKLRTDLMAMADTETEQKKKKQQKHSSTSCCISHSFSSVASESPNKIAVIHALGGSRIIKQRHNHSSSAERSEFGKEPPPLSSSNLYEGDQCFTYSQLLSSVDFLSFRLRCILSGGTDPYLIKSRGSNTINRELLGHAQVSSSFISLRPTEQSSEFSGTYTPKILGIYMAPSVEYIVAVLSILRCGEAFMPLDPFWPKEKILSVASSANVDLIIGSRSSLDIKDQFYLDKSHWLVHSRNCPIFCISMEDIIQEHDGPSQLDWPCKNEKQRSFCYLMYTSGSTGKAKGVCGTEHGLLNRFLWMQDMYPLLGEEYLLFKTSISFVDHLQEFLASVLTASTLVIPPFNELKDKLFYVVDFLQAYSINRLVAVPTLMRLILPALQSQCYMRVRSSLKLLVLSGETLPLHLWDNLSIILPETFILNLYGSTEVSGDCMYFDCKRLPMLLKTNTPSSVPIGIPISNCNVVLVQDDDAPNEGEIYVGGPCVCSGYVCEPSIMPSDVVRLPEDVICMGSVSEHWCHYFFKTGDFARRLQSGDLVFLGRKDRIMKVNGQRISLEEIENTLRGHPLVVGAAVVARKGHDEIAFLESYLVLKQKDESVQVSISSIQNWMLDRLSLAMLPNKYSIVESLPLTSTGKVDYAFLESATEFMKYVHNEAGVSQGSDLLQAVKKAFCNALAVDKVSEDDDFFAVGGNSIAAAHVAHTLGVDMRIIYIYPTPFSLWMALSKFEGSHSIDARINANLVLGDENVNGSFISETFDVYSMNPGGRLFSIVDDKKYGHPIISNRLGVDLDSYVASEVVSSRDEDLWSNHSLPVACSYSRCNKVLYRDESKVDDLPAWSYSVSSNKGFVRELWNVYMEACVDASPIVVFIEQKIYLFIGSHSHKFLCVNTKSGFVQWEVKLEGRVECSAAIVGDFSQVVVGCYRGKIYFLDFTNGNICWTFQTGGEVKSQPVVDKRRHLVWCGSHDHNLYALDYKSHCCIFKIPCGGSIYGSPAIDEVYDKIYVASTSGCLLATSIKSLPFSTLWQLKLAMPIFGSLCICTNGNVICCLVDGHVVSLSSNGSIAWKYKAGGPIFAGPCISYTLPSQVLICSRNGSVYSFEMEKGDLIWEYNVGDPITASAYVDENVQLVSDLFNSADRLICICTSSGSIRLLRINSNVVRELKSEARKDMVREFARLDLQGEIFSSPVMIGGRIFVGCRDDYLHCVSVETHNSEGKWKC